MASGVLSAEQKKFDANNNVNVNINTLEFGEDATNNLRAVAEKPLSVGTYCPDNDTSAAAEASSVTKNAPGVLYGFTFTNGNAGTRYLQFFNSTTLPADATVPVMSYACATNSTITRDFPKGRYFSTGIVWCNSSTLATKTIGAADSLTDVQFK